MQQASNASGNLAKILAVSLFSSDILFYNKHILILHHQLTFFLLLIILIKYFINSSDLILPQQSSSILKLGASQNFI